MKEPGKGQ